VDDCLADANELVGAYEPDAIVFGEDVWWVTQFIANHEVL
jgi:hypothetical protein